MAKKAATSVRVAKARKSSKVSKRPSLFSRLYTKKYAKQVVFVAVFMVVGMGTLVATYAAAPAGQVLSKYNNECLDNFFDKQENANYLSTYPCTSGYTGQSWTFAGDGSIRTQQNYCIDIPNSVKTPGTRVWLWQCNGGAGQKWTLRSNGTLRNPNSGLS